MSPSYPGSPSARDPGHPPLLGKRRFWEPVCLWDMGVYGNSASFMREPLSEFLSNRISEK
jgi:hypothetical protein